MSTRNGKKRLRGCENCRERHIKCDRGRPCNYCAKKGLNCVRAINWRFRHSYGTSVAEREFEFPTEQKWCVVAGKKLAFIDETIETTANNGEEDRGFREPLSPIQVSLNHEEDAIPGLPGLLPPPLARNLTPENGQDIEHEAGERDTFSKSPSFPEQSDGIISLADRYTSSPEVVYQIWQRSSVPEFGSEGVHGVSSYAQKCPSAQCLDICDPFSAEVSIFPLRELSEAELMRYYIDQVAPIFDLCDREMNFMRSVPEAAGSRPALMRIISIVATRHRESLHNHQPSLVDTDDRPWCEGHFDRALATRNRMLDWCAMATIVLIRFLAVIGTTLGVRSQEPRSTDIRDTFETQSQFLLPRGPHQAAFWAGIRQEIYLAILNERSTGLCLDKCNIDCSLEDAEDEVWMGRITLHLVEVLEFCFGSREIDACAYQKYESLAGYLAAWAASVPESFEPLFTRLPENEEVFPEIVFLSDCAMAAWHFYHLTRMLLIAHNPRFPRIGSSYMAAMQSMDNEIKSDVRILCGIAETHGNAYRACPPAIMGIVLAGDRFTNRREQQALFDFLVKVEKNHAWPTRFM
ncbi:hypothetical protein F4680DRAFT_434915 [Xylaria scruposa]|nr:hypothetical protein F4680DRAFT_434915 [Xylaria scruposa]